MAFVIALAVLATPALLFAHARLLRSTPAANETLTSLPTSLSLWFSEKPEVKFTVITLTDSAGATVALGPVAWPRNRKWADHGPDHSASDGRNRTIHRRVADRGVGRSRHIGQVCVLDQRSDAAPPRCQFVAARHRLSHGRHRSPHAVPITRFDTMTTYNKVVTNSLIEAQEVTTFSTAMRWAELVALLTLIGLVVFRLAVLPRAEWTPDLVAAASDRAARLGRGLLVLFAVGTISRGLAQASLLPTYATSRHDAIRELIHQTRWGGNWWIGLIGLAIVIIGYLLAGKMIAGWVIAALGLIVIVVASEVARRVTRRSVKHRVALAVAADVAHLLGAGGWPGGSCMARVCSAGFPALKRLDPKKGEQRLGRVAHARLSQLGDGMRGSRGVLERDRSPSGFAFRPSRLWTTPYGLALIRKTIFVARRLSASGSYHWRRVA